MEQSNDQMLHDILETVKLVQENSATKQDVQDIKQDVQDVLETVNFIKDTAVTKKELGVTNESVSRLEGRIDRLENSLDEKLVQTKSEILEHVDAFTKLHETLDQEMVSLRGKYDRLEERLVRVEQKLGFATA